MVAGVVMVEEGLAEASTTAGGEATTDLPGMVLVRAP